MTKIEYDNMNFKDKLTNAGKKNSPCKQVSNQENILDALGKLGGHGGTFFSEV